MHVWNQCCKPCQVMTRGNQRDRDRERAANRNAGCNLSFVTSVLRVCDDLHSFVKIEGPNSVSVWFIIVQYDESQLKPFVVISAPKDAFHACDSKHSGHTSCSNCLLVVWGTLSLGVVGPLLLMTASRSWSFFLL